MEKEMKWSDSNEAINLKLRAFCFDFIYSLLLSPRLVMEKRNLLLIHKINLFNVERIFDPLSTSIFMVISFWWFLSCFPQSSRLSFIHWFVSWVNENHDLKCSGFANAYPCLRSKIKFAEFFIVLDQNFSNFVTREFLNNFRFSRLKFSTSLGIKFLCFNCTIKNWLRSSASRLDLNFHWETRNTRNHSNVRPELLKVLIIVLWKLASYRRDVESETRNSNSRATEQIVDLNCTCYEWNRLLF